MPPGRGGRWATELRGSGAAWGAEASSSGVSEVGRAAIGDAPGRVRGAGWRDARSAAGAVYEYGRRRARPRSVAGGTGVAGSGPRRALGGRRRRWRRCRGDGVRVVPRRPDDVGVSTRSATGLGGLMELPTEQRRGPLFAAVFARAAGPVMRDDLAPIIDQVHPDVVVRETAELAAAPMAAARGHPARHGGLQRRAARTRPRPGDRRPAAAVAGRGSRRSDMGRRLRAVVPAPVPRLVRAASRLARRPAGPPRSGLTECHTARLGGCARHRSAVRVRDGGNRTAIGHVPLARGVRCRGRSRRGRGRHDRAPRRPGGPRHRTGQRPRRTVRPAGRSARPSQRRRLPRRRRERARRSVARPATTRRAALRRPVGERRRRR